MLQELRGNVVIFMGRGEQNHRRHKEELTIGLSLKRRVGFGTKEEGNRR